jgi:hypothetical protein
MSVPGSKADLPPLNYEARSSPVTGHWSARVLVDERVTAAAAIAFGRLVLKAAILA